MFPSTNGADRPDLNSNSTANPNHQSNRPQAPAAANSLGSNLVEDGYTGRLAPKQATSSDQGTLAHFKELFNFKFSLPNLGIQQLIQPSQPVAAPVMPRFSFSPKPIPEGMTSPYHYRAHLNLEEDPRDDEETIAVGIQGNLDKNGVLTFDVTRGQTTPSGREMMAKMLEAFKQFHGPHGQGIKTIRCNWSDEPGSNTNYKLYQDTRDPFKTKTGTWAKEHGFTQATTRIDTEGHVVIDFSHPEPK